MKAADVAIVIVTYNSEDEIEACLASVLEEAGDLRQQIIVVDNDSQDGTVERIRERFADQVELILPGANLGFAAGINLGASHAHAEFVLLLNPDTVVVRRAVETLVTFARRHPEYGIYGGRTLTPEGELEPSSCWGQPTLWSLFLFACGLTTLAPRNRWLDPESLGDWRRDSVREVGVVTGCFLLAPVEIWKLLGGLDERFFMYGEDVDFAIRARDAGYRPVICPEAEVIHEVGQSSSSPIHKTRLLYRGKASLVRLHWTGFAQRLGLFLLAAGTGMRAALGAVKGTSESANRWQTLWSERSDWLQGYESKSTTRVSRD